IYASIFSSFVRDQEIRFDARNLIPGVAGVARRDHALHAADVDVDPRSVIDTVGIERGDLAPVIDGQRRGRGITAAREAVSLARAGDHVGDQPPELDVSRVPMDFQLLRRGDRLDDEGVRLGAEAVQRLGYVDLVARLEGEVFLRDTYIECLCDVLWRAAA